MTREKSDRARRKDDSRTTNWNLRRPTLTNLFFVIALSLPYLCIVSPRRAKMVGDKTRNVASLASTFSDLRGGTKLRVWPGISDIQFRRTRSTRVRGNLGTFRDNSVVTTLIYSRNKQRISSSGIRLFGVAIAREEIIYLERSNQRNSCSHVRKKIPAPSR